ncbi:MAG: ATP-binding protein [Pseudolabrys sp.]
MKWMYRFCFGAMLLIALANPVDAAEPYRVLLLYSFGPYFSPWNTITPAFREELRKQFPHPIDLYEASLQGERSGESPAQEEGPFTSYLNALFPARDLRLIVAMGAPATRFVLRNRAQLFPSAPLLIASSDVRTFSDLTLTANETACATTYDPAVQIDAILQVLPNTTDIVVATGGSATERFWTDAFRRSFQRFSSRVTFHWFTDLSAEEMLKRVTELPPRSVIYYPTIRVDARGAPQEGDAMLFRFIELDRAPIFTHVDSHFGQGIVGGPIFSSREIGQRCAEVAVRILNGETPGDIKMPPVGLAKPVYDWRQLQRWHISESVLPPGSEILFRVPTAWEQYRAYIVAFIAAILIQSALISWLLYEQRRRQRAEVLARNTMSELTHVNRVATVGQLSASIAHEIRQPLAAILANANAALRWLEKANVEEVREGLKGIVSDGHRAGDIITNLRAMFKHDVQEKTPVDINKLVLSVLALVQIDLQKQKIELQTQLDDRISEVLGNQVQLQQVISNLVMNAIEAMSSSKTRMLRIKTELSRSNKLHVSIEDTGTGIKPSDVDRLFKPMFTTKARGMGMGLSICQSIIETHGGRIWVSPGANGGSIFQFELPTTAAKIKQPELV